jgi:hypothetical protein
VRTHPLRCRAWKEEAEEEETEEEGEEEEEGLFKAMRRTLGATPRRAKLAISRSPVLQRRRAAETELYHL